MIIDVIKFMYGILLSQVIWEENWQTHKYYYYEYLPLRWLYNASLTTSFQKSVSYMTGAVYYYLDGSGVSKIVHCETNIFGYLSSVWRCITLLQSNVWTIIFQQGVPKDIERNIQIPIQKDKKRKGDINKCFESLSSYKKIYIPI